MVVDGDWGKSQVGLRGWAVLPLTIIAQTLLLPSCFSFSRLFPLLFCFKDAHESSPIL